MGPSDTFWAWTGRLWCPDPALLGQTGEESQLHNGSESPSQEIPAEFIQPIPGSGHGPLPLGTTGSLA